MVVEEQVRADLAVQEQQVGMEDSFCPFSRDPEGQCLKLAVVDPLRRPQQAQQIVSPADC